MPQKVCLGRISTIFRIKESKQPLTFSWCGHTVESEAGVPYPFCVQGNLTNQKPVTIYDPIHDAVREMLSLRYVSAWLSKYRLTNLSLECMSTLRLFQAIYSLERGISMVA